MKNRILNVLIALVLSLVYLFCFIALKVPFFTIFLVGCGLLIIGLIVALFFDKETIGRRIATLVSSVGGLSAIMIWVLVRFLLSRLQ